MRGALENYKQVGMWEYDFAKDGGAVGDITLRGPKLPVGAIVTGEGWVKVYTAVTSDGAATVALKITTAEDVLAATGKASFTLNALLDAVPDEAAANAITVATAAKGVTATVATAALTAGKFVVILEYIVPTDD
jgi:hypothetical protein